VLAARPLNGVELARETMAFIEAAGKDAPPRRARLRAAFDTALDVFSGAARVATGAGTGVVSPAIAAWSHDPDVATAAIECTLDALAAIDRNANLGVLVDAWTAILEEPRLAREA
jgi:DNA polymerase-3 subunit delta'